MESEIGGVVYVIADASTWAHQISYRVGIPSPVRQAASGVACQLENANLAVKILIRRNDELYEAIRKTADSLRRGCLTRNEQECLATSLDVYESDLLAARNPS